MRKQLKVLTKLQSFDNRMDTIYKSGLSPTKFRKRKPGKKQRQLLKKREGLARKINPYLLKKYERMRQSKIKSNIIVPVINGVCQGCFMEVTKSVIIELMQGEDLVSCEHCGRILYLEEQQE